MKYEKTDPKDKKNTKAYTMDKNNTLTNNLVVPSGLTSA
jgi:hypothetical protein